MRLELAMLALLFGSGAAWGDVRCDGYKWDVSRELALFADAGEAVTAGRDLASGPTLRAGRLYRVHLVPQAEASFVVAPGRNLPPQDAYAGVARLQFDSPGDYRIAVDAPLWIDVAAGTALARVVDFQGQHDCAGPRKIVEFELTATGGQVLQLSGSPQSDVRLTVTKAPLRKS